MKCCGCGVQSVGAGVYSRRKLCGRRAWSTGRRLHIAWYPKPLLRGEPRDEHSTHIDGTNSRPASRGAVAPDNTDQRHDQENITCLTPTGVAQMRCSDNSVAALAASYTKARPCTTLTRGRRKVLPVGPSCCAKSAGCDDMPRKEADPPVYQVGRYVRRELRTAVASGHRWRWRTGGTGRTHRQYFI